MLLKNTWAQLAHCCCRFLHAACGRFDELSVLRLACSSSPLLKCRRREVGARRSGRRSLAHFLSGMLILALDWRRGSSRNAAALSSSSRSTGSDVPCWRLRSSRLVVFKWAALLLDRHESSRAMTRDATPGVCSCCCFCSSCGDSLPADDNDRSRILLEHRESDIAL